MVFSCEHTTRYQIPACLDPKFYNSINSINSKKQCSTESKVKESVHYFLPGFYVKQFRERERECQFYMVEEAVAFGENRRPTTGNNNGSVTSRD